MHRQAGSGVAERPRTAPAARPLARRLLATIAIFALIVGACGSSGPIPSSAGSAGPSSSVVAPTASSGGTPSSSPAASDNVEAVYGTIEQQVVAIRGLTAKSPVHPKVLDDAGIKKLTADSFAKDNPDAVIKANERILKAFGLLPQDASLRTLYIDLLGSQVAGLYNPDDKQLYVVSKSGGIGATEKSTFSHEFTHALQDQNFDLGALKLDEIGQGDRSFARLAVVEGDATLTMSYWQIQHLSQAELGQLVAGASDDESTKQLLAMPAILRESLLFPYIHGLTFVQGIQASRGWGGVNDVFAAPPASTEQILHPDKYAAHEPPAVAPLPASLATALGSGWKVTLEDTFGEFQLGIWLRSNTALSTAQANDAAAGWGGDRIAVVEGPNDSWGVILHTTWDTDADASAFETAARPIVDGLAGAASLLPGEGGRGRWIVVASDDATLGAVAGAAGLAG